MKITFILPAIGKKKNEKYIGTWKMEPLTIAVLKALTPDDIETEFFDDRIELINFNTKTDLVAITVETYTAMRSYEIATKFREKGVRVIGGGYHVTLNQYEALDYFDCIITHNSEKIWGTVLSDFRNGTMKSLYVGNTGSSEIMPDRSIFKGKKYLPVSLVETGRGCIHNCEFCAIAGFYKCSYFKRDINAIVRDIKNSPNKYFFIVDDNLVADTEHAKNIFKALIPLKIKWAGQGTLSMGNDKELLTLMKKSGCELILIGFESLETKNLKQMKKSWNNQMDTDILVQNIHDAGIGIYATFVLGYDSDTFETINDTLNFAKKHNFFTAAFNHLLPFPGTNLYERLKTDRSLIFDKWWLDDNYKYGQLSFNPKNMKAEELSLAARNARKEFAKFPVVFRRGMAHMRRSSPSIWWLFWAINLRLGEEIDEKMYVPLGKNLDEYPK